MPHTSRSFPRRCVPEQSLSSWALLFGVVCKTLGISHPALGTPGLRSRDHRATDSWVRPPRGEVFTGVSIDSSAGLFSEAIAGATAAGGILEQHALVEEFADVAQGGVGGALGQLGGRSAVPHTSRCFLKHRRPRQMARADVQYLDWILG